MLFLLCFFFYFCFRRVLFLIYAQVHFENVKIPKENVLGG